METSSISQHENTDLRLSKKDTNVNKVNVNNIYSTKGGSTLVKRSLNLQKLEQK